MGMDVISVCLFVLGGGAVHFFGKNIPILDVSEGGMVERILMLGFMHSF